MFLAGDDPVIAEVKAGGLRKKSHLVPVRGMTVGRSFVRADWASRRVTEAPGPPKEKRPLGLM